MEWRYHTAFLLAALAVVLQTDFSYGQCAGTPLTLTANSTLQTISSPNYPNPYSNSESCEWNITTADPHVLFYVYDDNLEFRFDHLSIYSGVSTFGNRLFYSDDDSAPFVDRSDGNGLYVTFTSDYSITYGGFLMYYMSLESSPECTSTKVADSSAQQLVHIWRESNQLPCTFTITAANRVKITVLFLSGTITVTDGSDVFYLYDEGNVYVSAESSITLLGNYNNDFVITYENETSSVTNSIYTITPSPSDTVTCGDASVLTATATPKYIISPNYPGPYPNYFYCSVRIQAQNSSESVYIYVVDYEVGYGDVAIMYDGPDSTFNQETTDIPGVNFTSTGDEVYLVFSTNSYGQDRGFSIEYKSVARVDVTSVIPDLNGSFSASSTRQTILSPNYPNAYDNNADINWLITKPNQEDNLVLDFIDFEVESAVDCIYDKLTIYDGYLTTDPVLAVLCGYEESVYEDSSGLYVLIRFQTDSSVTKKGFHLEFYIGEVGGGATDESTEEDDEGFPVQYIAIAVVFGFLLFALIVTIVFIKFGSRKRRVAAGTQVPAKPQTKKLTTHQLLEEMTRRYGSKLAEHKTKTSWKKKGTGYHPQPDLTGPNVVVINKGRETPHPPPGQGFGGEDPAFPPQFLGAGTESPPGLPVAAVLTNIPKPPPKSDTESYYIDPNKVPPPFPYLTPAEARAKGGLT